MNTTIIPERSRPVTVRPEIRDDIPLPEPIRKWQSIAALIKPSQSYGPLESESDVKSLSKAMERNGKHYTVRKRSEGGWYLWCV